MAQGKRSRRKRQRYRIVLRRVAIAVVCISFGSGIYFAVGHREEEKISWNNENVGERYGSNTKNVSDQKKDIPVILQNPELPSGCESAAAVMLLKAYGFEVDKEEFANALPWCALEESEGRVYACHPQDAFVGSPYSSGYGVFSNIVADTIQKFIDRAGGKFWAEDISGSAKQRILNYLESGIPVCVWVTMDLREVQYKTGWYIKRGDNYTDEYFEWPAGEHCMLLVGYEGEKVIVHDPLQGKMEYDLDTFFQRYRDMGCQAIILRE